MQGDFVFALNRVGCTNAVGVMCYTRCALFEDAQDASSILRLSSFYGPSPCLLRSRFMQEPGHERPEHAPGRIILRTVVRSHNVSEDGSREGTNRNVSTTGAPCGTIFHVQPLTMSSGIG